MERGVEYGYLFHAGKDFFRWKEYLPSWPDCAVERSGTVSGSSPGPVWLPDSSPGKFAAVRYAVTDGLHFVERPDYAVHGVGQGLKHQADARRVVGNRLVEFELLLADGFVREIAFRRPMRSTRPLASSLLDWLPCRSPGI